MADGQEAEDISPTRTPVRPVMKCWTVLFLVFGVSSTADWASAVVPGADLSSETEFHFDLSSRRDELRKEEPAKPVGGTSSFEVEGRTRKGGVLKKMALPFLLLLGLKAGITVPVIFGIVALVAFKGMWSGFTALVVTAALALRGLIPPSKIIQLPPATPHHVHVADYITDYRRDDHIGRVDEGAYHPYNGPNVPSSYLPPNY